MDPSVRTRIVELLRTAVVGCFARAPEGDESPPIVLCARHKAVAIEAELAALAGNEEAVLAQLEANRHAAIASGRFEQELSTVFDAGAAELRAAAATKRVALQTEAVAVDAALEDALAAVAALTEVRDFSTSGEKGAPRNIGRCLHRLFRPSTTPI